MVFVTSSRERRCRPTAVCCWRNAEIMLETSHPKNSVQSLCVIAGVAAAVVVAGVAAVASAAAAAAIPAAAVVLHLHWFAFAADAQLDFSTNALGSRIIVHLLDNSTDEARRLMLTQLLPHIRSLAADMAGNFIVQKLLDICTAIACCCCCCCCCCWSCLHCQRCSSTSSSSCSCCWCCCCWCCCCLVGWLVP